MLRASESLALGDLKVTAAEGVLVRAVPAEGPIVIGRGAIEFVTGEGDDDRLAGVESPEPEILHRLGGRSYQPREGFKMAVGPPCLRISTPEHDRPARVIIDFWRRGLGGLDDLLGHRSIRRRPGYRGRGTHEGRCVEQHRTFSLIEIGRLEGDFELRGIDLRAVPAELLGLTVALSLMPETRASTKVGPF